MTVFEAAKEASCVEAALKLGLRGKRTRTDRGVFSCPLHVDNTPSLVCYDENSHFHCFSCRKHGDATDLYAMTLGLRPYHAAQRVCGDFGLQWDQGPSRPTVPEVPRTPSAEATVITGLCRAWKQLLLQIAKKELEEAAIRLDELKTPSAPGWNMNLMRTVRFQDEYNRVYAMGLGDMLEMIKEDLKTTNKERYDGTA